MLKSLRAALALAAAAGLLATPASALRHGAARPAAAQAPAAALAPGQWAQARSDIAADPDMLFGALPNGMRYAIKRQAMPAGQAALRLWVGAGSLDERDSQQGLAHFLEHMAFNGSKAVKEGEMVKILERLGLAFGPDTNAATGFEETVYKLDLPRASPDAVDTSLMLMRETAGNLTIAQDSVDRERGVVLSEERARDTPGFRILKSRLAFYMAGQRLPTRLPIGKVAVLRSASAGLIRDFYEAHYRPEHTVLVAVGDFDPRAIEAQIRARFSDWRASAPAQPEPPAGPVRPRGEAAKLVIEPGAPFSLQVAWVGPPDLSPDSRAKQRRDFVDQLGLAVLNRRFSALSRSAAPPFISASAGKYDQTRTARITQVSVVADADHWRQALAAVDLEQRRAARFGVRQDELDREVVEVRARLLAAVEGAQTRRPADIADAVVGTLADNDVATSPAQDLALFEEIVKGLTAREASAALARSFSGSGPLVFASSPKPIAGGEATLRAALDAARRSPVTPPAAALHLAWPYQSFGPPGRIVERRQVGDLGVTFVRFANGVRLTVKPTGFREKEVLVRVSLGRGMQDLSGERQTATWAFNAFVEGGLGKISIEDMDRVLADKLYGARLSAGDDAFVLSGGTRTSDLPTQLQVLAAYVADPGWRREAFRRLQASGATVHAQYEATDSGLLARDLPGILHGGDGRWTFPTREEIAEARPEDLQAALSPVLAGGSIEVVIVGDVAVEAAIDQGRFGRGARRPSW